MGALVELVKGVPPYLTLIVLFLLGLVCRFIFAIVDEAAKDTWEAIKAWSRHPPQL